MKNSIKYYVLSIKVIIAFIFCLILAIYYLIPTIYAQTNSFDQINQKVCDRFEEDIQKLGAIMEELRTRKGITETRVAFGGSDTPIEVADYWVNYAAEALAFQRAQEYSSKNQLKSNLETLKGKILRAKTEIGKALDE